MLEHASLSALQAPAWSPLILFSASLAPGPHTPLPGLHVTGCFPGLWSHQKPVPQRLGSLTGSPTSGCSLDSGL